ncbi:MAG: protease HtpX [Chromatiales bacterium]|nr:protease HtpX [Chromatiales bacterium]
MLRIGLFLATNVAIMVVISVVFSLLGLEGILAENGVDLNLQALLIMSTIIGFSGSFISLFISKFMAKRSMGVRIIEEPANPTERWLMDTLRMQSSRAGISTPEMGIFDSPEPNAFATGWNKNNALVAVSTGLLERMKKGEVEAVVAHEVSHVANGDMITMALIQGVVNTFVVFLARLVGFFVDRVILKNQRGLGIGYFVTSIIAQIFLSILASTIVMWFSRRREFSADAGGASLAGRQNMINALAALGGPAQAAAAELPDQMAGFGISGKFGSLFASHPPLEARIAALKAQQ